MHFLILLLISGSTLFEFQIEKRMAPWTKAAHEICLGQIPQELHHKDILEALICGAPIADEQKKDALKASHMIHLIIISAGHFLIMEKWLCLLKTSWAFQTFLFWGYGVTTLLQPPAVRFLAQRALSDGFTYCNIRTRPHQLIFWSSLCTIAFFPDWSSSSSFLLSWACALTLQISHLFVPEAKNAFHKMALQQFYFLLFVSPWLISFGNWHPLQVVSQLILAPVLLVMIFPVGIACLAFRFLGPFFDLFFEFFLFVMNQFKDMQPQSTPGTSFSPIWAWGYLLALHVLIHFFDIYQRRNLS